MPCLAVSHSPALYNWIIKNHIIASTFVSDIYRRARAPLLVLVSTTRMHLIKASVTAALKRLYLIQNLVTKFLLELITSRRAELPHPGHLCSFELIWRFYYFFYQAFFTWPISLLLWILSTYSLKWCISQAGELTYWLVFWLCGWLMKVSHAMNEFDSTQIYLDVSILLHVKALIHNVGPGERGRRQTKRGEGAGGKGWEFTAEFRQAVHGFGPQSKVEIGISSWWFHCEMGSEEGQREG